MKKMLLIVNPCAGQKKARRFLADMIGLFNQSGYAVTAHMTSCQGEGEEICKKLAEGMDLVVCCGGDGTFNETISGLLKSGLNIPVGYIPAGSTNDFAAGLQLSTNIMKAARDVVEGGPVELDVGSFQDRYFSYVASFGAFTKTSYNTPQSMKNALGHAAYVLSGIQELAQIRAHTLRFELPDGEVIEDRFLFGAISNSTSVGGVLTLKKELVDLSDGKFELLLVRFPKDLVELTGCLLALQRQKYDHPMLYFRSADSIKVSTTEESLDWTLDGEHEVGQQELEVRCLHKAVSVIRKV